MNLVNQKFTIRQVAEIHAEKIPTLQSWADKGWARITPAPGPGQARELSIVDVYSLSIAIAFTRIGVEARVANQIADSAVLYGETWQRANARTWAELGETPEQYFSGSPERMTRSGPEVKITLADVDKAFRWRDQMDPYHLFVQAGVLSCHPQASIVLRNMSPLPVNFIRVRSWARENPEGLATELVVGSLSNVGHYINVTELLLYVDDALRNPTSTTGEKTQDVISFRR